ncbi:cytochrome (ubi)quinol oxidase subunit III [Lichenibacterium dinghuense]|uniref:cytochrome (ubi)quinol oxidase subunit III n=1 Tax=Lichenibacterium dinghuense TaxID=2895977 RepID=UPI001F27A7B6|nr:cytochrome (ubi)quinol oxidase subunit III [Lichenibacterium sp. 6Y81]
MTSAFAPAAEPGRALDARARKSPPDPYRVGHGGPGGGGTPSAPGRGTGGPAPKRIVVGYGFWLFILSDIIMFATFFAAYAVLHGNADGGPTPPQLFSLGNTGVETVCLLLSSYGCGAAALAAKAEDRRLFTTAMGITFALGLLFVGLEAREFADLVGRGAGPSRSAFLSSFFALVGCHGLHVSAGLLWLLTMVAQVWAKGFRADILRRLYCWTLFWHALDIIWVGVFTVVYVMGVYA